MGTTWHRSVAVATNADGEEYLNVTVTPGAGQNPPDRPSDNANNVYVSSSDRANGGAQVIYTLTGQNGTLGYALADAGSNDGKSASLPTGYTVTPNGNTLTITDTAAAGVDFSYYVTLGDIRTPDPMIHNGAAR